MRERRKERKKERASDKGSERPTKRKERRSQKATERKRRREASKRKNRKENQRTRTQPVHVYCICLITCTGVFHFKSSISNHVRRRLVIACACVIVRVQRQLRSSHQLKRHVWLSVVSTKSTETGCYKDIEHFRNW